MKLGSKFKIWNVVQRSFYPHFRFYTDGFRFLFIPYLQFFNYISYPYSCPPIPKSQLKWMKTLEHNFSTFILLLLQKHNFIYCMVYSSTKISTSKRHTQLFSKMLGIYSYPLNNMESAHYTILYLIAAIHTGSEMSTGPENYWARFSKTHNTIRHI